MEWKDTFPRSAFHQQGWEFNGIFYDVLFDFLFLRLNCELLQDGKLNVLGYPNVGEPQDGFVIDIFFLSMNIDFFCDSFMCALMNELYIQ